MDIPDHKVVPLDSTVSVRVEVGEEQTERRFNGVVVRMEAGGEVTPATSAVVVRGPRSVVEALRPEELRLLVTLAEDGSPTTRLALPPVAQGRVVLVNTNPSEFTVNR